jgi:hypothetical protein
LQEAIMIRISRLLAGALGATFALLGASATAQGLDNYAVVEERSTYYAPEAVYYARAPEVVYYASPAETVYYAPPIVVERQLLTEDQMITENVRAVLDSDPRIDSSRIAVETQQNSVALSGLVGTPGQARIARRDAQQVEGVHEVRNYIRSRVGDSSSN